MAEPSEKIPHNNIVPGLIVATGSLVILASGTGISSNIEAKTADRATTTYAQGYYRGMADLYFQLTVGFAYGAASTMTAAGVMYVVRRRKS